MKRFRPCYAALLFVFAFVSLLHAQQTINNASLSGRVTDPAGAVVQNARVMTKQIATNIVRSTATDSEGRFRFPYLAVGTYEVTVEDEGFANVSRSVTLTVGADFHLPISLSVAGQQTAVNVDAAAPVLEMNRSEVAETVSPDEVQNLSLLGRNFLDLALLVPGVSPTNTASTQLFAETSAVPGQGISVSSQRNFSNSFIVDGLSSNDDAAGLTGTFYGLDVVREFQVVTSGGQAEFGRALGGYINMVTKSGTNQAPRQRLWLPPQSTAQREQCSIAKQAADHARPIRREPWRADPARSHLLLRKLRAQAVEPERHHHHNACERRRDQ